MLQKLSGRSVNPGLQMFGQSISGGVDMDGNGYAGTLAAARTPSVKTTQHIIQSNHRVASPAAAVLRTRDEGILFTAFHS